LPAVTDRRYSSTRREFVATLLKGAAGLALSHRMARAEELSGGALTSTRLADNLMLITGAGGNVVVATGPDGALMVNGGLGERSNDLLKLVAAETGSNSVQVLFNTDWHWDNTGSNETLGKAGAKIIAHENTKLWLGAEVDVEWQKRIYKPLPAKALPAQTIFNNRSGKITFGKQQVTYGHVFQAHTDGDIYVFFPESNVLVTGDVFTVGAYPIPDYSTGGWLGGLVNGTKTLMAVGDAKTRVIPGIGPVQTRAELQAQLEMLSKMKDRIVEMMKLGKGNEEIIAAKPTAEFDEKWGDPTVFMSVVYRGLWSHVRELGGIV
jgi:glyoxylase-like metal-dependent hydrolase (beta-lactamase superfamily II)